TVGTATAPSAAAPSPEAGAAVARREATRGIVLLKNEGLLPLLADAKSIAVIGGHADAGVISGAGSSQVAEQGGPAVVVPMGGEGFMAFLRNVYYHGSSPLKALQARIPAASIHYVDASYPSAAAALARKSDVAIVFATQWMLEGYDSPDISLPDGQDVLIAAVAAANPRTIVVLETGGPVLMPWLDKVGAVVEAWYPGARGGEAITDILTGAASPSGRLPVTFPASLSQLPRPEIPGFGLPDAQVGAVRYPEGSDVGYRWFAAKGLKPLFPFGYGLSYTRFAYDDLKVTGGATLTVSFTVHNAGARAGVDTPQVYLTAAPNRRQQRLVGWSTPELGPGESRRVSLSVDPRLLADWDERAHGWRIAGGAYKVALARSATDFVARGQADVGARTLAP
ncbi:MAG: glycoside hydrolase family 3 C-terminal domain-containing protein, partial [Caulobacteraceae bacterium]|nr:glycoside hydrolase family 3 C-terminal domain-containing protein [Caulobacter sp.]